MKSLNHNDGKLRPSLVLRDMPYAWEQLLKAREEGARKYARDNWALSKGQPEAKDWLGDNADSVMRHIMAIERGEQTDTESGLSHWAHVACRALMALEYEG